MRQERTYAEPTAHDVQARTPRIVWRLLLANCLMRAIGAATGVIVALYLARIHAEIRPVSALEVALIVTIAYSAVELSLSPIAGALSDRHGSLWLLLCGPLVAAAGVQLTAFTTSTAMLVATRLLEGVGAAFTSPLLLKEVTVATAHDAGLRARCMALFELSTFFGFLLGMALGAFAFDLLSRSVFALLALAYLITSFLLWHTRVTHVPPGSPALQGWSWSRYAELLRTPQLWRFAPAWLAVNAITGLWLGQISFQLAGPTAPDQALVGRFSEREVGSVYAVYGATVVAGLLLWTRWLPGRRQTQVMLLALIGMLSSCFATWMLNSLAHSPAQKVLAVTWLALSIIIETGFAPAALAFLGDVSDLRAWDRGTVMGLYNVLFGAGQLLGGWLGGIAASWWAINGLIWATLGITLLAFGSVLSLRRFEHETGRVR